MPGLMPTFRLAALTQYGGGGGKSHHASLSSMPNRRHTRFLHRIFPCVMQRMLFVCHDTVFIEGCPPKKIA
jgi:hypothetical protein